VKYTKAGAVWVGDHPNPVGFVDVGTIAADGIKLKHPADGDRRIRTTGSAYVSIRVDFTAFDPLVLAAIFSPLAALALQFRRITAHWYLQGDDQ
jgi:hypothetical protein